MQVLCAQIKESLKKGNFITGGSISLDFSRSKTYAPSLVPNMAWEDAKTITFMPDLDLKYLVTDHLALGLITEDFVSSSRFKDNLSGNNEKDIINDIYLGPEVRYYIKSGLFITCFGELGYYKRSRDIQQKYLFGAGFGYSAFLNKSVAIEPLLRFNHYHSNNIKYSNQSETKNTLTFSIGVQLFFNLRKTQLNQQKEKD
jgi:hypothetical protein